MKEKTYNYKISSVEKIEVKDYGGYITLQNISDTGGHSGEVPMPKGLLHVIAGDIDR